MTLEKLKQLKELIAELADERINFYVSKGYDIDNMSYDEVYNLDRKDNLLEGCDIVFDVAEKLEKIQTRKKVR